MQTIGKMGAALLLAMMLGAAPATRPVTRDGAGVGVEQDAFELGSVDFAARQAATIRIWWAAEKGGAAMAALRKAAMSDNPEAAARAAAVLRDIDDGIAPSTSQSVIQLTQQYASANNFDQPRIIGALRGAGVDGARVLLRLEQHEKDDRRREALDRLLAEAPRLPVAILLSEGKRDQAEAMLTDSSRINVYSAQDFVAYWQGQPPSRRKVAALRQVDIDRTWWTQSMLDPIDSEHTKAIQQAMAGGQTALAYWMSAERGNWAELLRNLSASKSPARIRDLAARALVANLAEDEPELGRLARQIPSLPAQPRLDEHQTRALAMCLADRPDDAVQMLEGAGDFDLAWDLLIPQLQYSQQLALLDRAKGNALQTVRLQVRAALLLHRLGKDHQAQYLLGQAIGGNRLVRDPNSALDLVAAAWKMHLSGKADDILAEAARGQSLSPMLLQRAGFSHYMAIDFWCMFLLHRQPALPPIQVIHMLRAIDAGKVSAGELGTLTREFEHASASMSSGEQRAVLQSEAVAWGVAGRSDRQLDALKRAVAALPSADSFMILGDCAEKQQDWSDAADAYGKAAQYDPADALAAFLHGWALTKLGNEQQGRVLMNLAHDLPLADEPMRTALYVAAKQRGLDADADHERSLLLATGNYDSSFFDPFLRLMAGEALMHKDYASAARYLEQSMWATVYTQGGFNAGQAYVVIPAEVHRIRAMALFTAGRPDAAMTEARMFDRRSPNDSTGLGLLIRAADAAGATRQADELFRTSIAQFTSVLHDFPDSPDLNNQIAWEEVLCRRDLDDALAHAQRGVQLDPDNAAILDTLAEVYYQRKEFQPAVDTMNRCIALEPSDDHFAKQLVRFQLALKTGVVDDQ